MSDPIPGLSRDQLRRMAALDGVDVAGDADERLSERYGPEEPAEDECETSRGDHT